MGVEIGALHPAAAPLAGHSNGGHQTAITVSAASPTAQARQTIAASSKQEHGQGDGQAYRPEDEQRGAANSLARGPALGREPFSHLPPASTNPPAPSGAAQQSDVAEREQQEQAQKLLESLQALREFKGWSLDFTLSEHSGKQVVQVLDSQSRELIRQIPSEEVLALRERLRQQLDEQDGPGLGILLDSKA